MKLKNLTFVIFLSYNFLNSQSDPSSDIFVNYKPKWAHAALDSTAIGYKNRTGTDFYLTIAESKSIIKEGHLYLVYLNSSEEISGYFIEKLDIKTGNQIWQRAFDLRHNQNREMPNHFSINNQNQLVVCSFENTQDSFFISWARGKLTTRILDISNGNLISETYSPKLDRSFPELPANTGSIRVLNLNDTGTAVYYSFYNSLKGYGRAFIKLDVMGKFISSDTFYNSIVFKNVESGVYNFDLLNHSFDTIVNLHYSHKFRPHKTGDSISLKLNLFNRNLKLLNTYDISEKVKKVDDFGLAYAQNGRINLFSKEYFQDSTSPRQILYSFDVFGNLKEEIIYHTRINEPFGRCVGMYKLKNDPGLLIINRGTSNGKERIFFYKTDGNGNMILLKEIETALNYNMGSALGIHQLDNGDLLYSAPYTNAGVKADSFYFYHRYITTMWDAKSLGLTTQVENGERSLDKAIICPNPSDSYFKIKNLNLSNATIEVYNEAGQIMLAKSCKHIDSEIFDIHHWNDGFYFVQIYNSDNYLVYAGKFVKEN